MKSSPSTLKNSLAPHPALTGMLPWTPVTGHFGGKKPNLVFMKGGVCWKAGPLVIARQGHQNEGLELIDWLRERTQSVSMLGHRTSAQGRLSIETLYIFHLTLKTLFCSVTSSYFSPLVLMSSSYWHSLCKDKQRRSECCQYEPHSLYVVWCIDSERCRDLLELRKTCTEMNVTEWI